jgi:hypothetical protein
MKPMADMEEGTPASRSKRVPRQQGTIDRLDRVPQNHRTVDRVTRILEEVVYNPGMTFAELAGP